MADKPVRDYDKFMLRFPDGMRDAITAKAKANGRSMNSEIIQILQDAIDLSSGKENVSKDEIFGMILKLRRHSQEQDFLINELVQIMNNSDKKPT